MIVTPLVAAQSIGTGSNVGSDKFPTKLALDAATTAFAVEVSLTNGSAKYDARQDMQMYYAVSSWDVAAANAPALLRQQARYIHLQPGPNGGEVRSRQSLLEPNLGGFLYVWFELPVTVVASTLNANAIELP